MGNKPCPFCGGEMVGVWGRSAEMVTHVNKECPLDRSTFNVEDWNAPRHVDKEIDELKFMKEEWRKKNNHIGGLLTLEKQRTARKDRQLNRAAVYIQDQHWSDTKSIYYHKHLSEIRKELKEK